MFPALRLHHRDLPQTQRFDGLRPSSAANAPDLALVHEHASTRHADEAHVREHGPVVAVFEFCPDAALGLGDVLKVGRRRRSDGASCDVAQKSGAEEDGENSEVLFGVLDGQVPVSGTKSVLNARAEVVRKRHSRKRFKLALKKVVNYNTSIM